MNWLLVVILALLVVALYPVVRDFLRKRGAVVPAYVEGLKAALDGNVGDAIARLKEAVAAESENVDAYVRLGDLFMQKGEIERGLKVHEDLALRRNLDKREEKKVLAALVRDYVKTDRKVKAVSVLEELAHLDKSDVAAAEQLITLYVETEAWDKCEEQLKALARGSANQGRAARLYTELGRAYLKGNPGAALTAFQTALKLDPRSIAARLYLGDYQLSQGDTDAAIRAWNEILELAPERNELVRERLERAYFDAGRFEDITTLYERLLRRVPTDAGLAIALAEIHQKKEDLASAKRLLELFGGSAPGRVAVRLALARLYLETNEPEQAQSILAEVQAALQSALPGATDPGRPA